MSRKDELNKKIKSARAKIRDNSRSIDAATRQILLDEIRAAKTELAQIDSEERASSRKIVTVVDAPTGKSVVAKTNSNTRRIIGNSGNMIRMGVR